MHSATLSSIFCLCRLVTVYEDEVLHDPDSSSIYLDLMMKYDDISFARFVDYVLAAAENQNCSSASSECQINENFRCVNIKLYMSAYQLHMTYKFF